MPCTYDGPPGASVVYTENPQIRRDAEKATRAACEMKLLLRELNQERNLTVETRQWIAKHDKEDAKRLKVEMDKERHEQLKRDALTKLTVDERRALGLK
jgi:hypothetical protein